MNAYITSTDALSEQLTQNVHAHLYTVGQAALNHISNGGL